ncbi:MAG: Dam family site-specific DNA-(adenine-N6)-methyltransferase [Gammaproteobacteria bacterium]|nr:Dam family site-specific DNA-(adenine-N6)-methyltransferase [Gammaproteobacteria bacterium]
MTSTTAPALRPFLKWAGNKYRLLERIRAKLPPGRRLVEPFVGSGAVFLNTDYPRYLLTDTNPDLIGLYRLLQAEGRDFINACRPLFTPANNRADRYYRLRAEFNRTRDEHRRAVLFVYLNRHGYNGLCRYNSRGVFNVPFGSYKRPYFPEAEMLAFHAKAPRAVFRLADFGEIMKKARSGDVVYCDPPYVPLSASSNFTTYSAKGFSSAQQCELAAMARELAQRDIPVLISNHDTAFTRDAYAGALMEDFHVQRHISCKGHQRGKAGELLALFT